MRKRERLEVSSSNTKLPVILKTTKVDFRNLKEKANTHAKGRGIRNEGSIVAIDKQLLANLIGDYETLLRSLKNLGGFFERELHYSESKEWKASISKPYKLKDVPTFLHPPKKEKSKP